MLTPERREDIRRVLDELTDPKKLPIDNVQIEAGLLAALRAILEIDEAVNANGSARS